jgi:hypothetical protein
MNKHSLWARLRAFALHLSLSVLVVGAGIVTMAWAWYPSPLADLEGWLHLLMYVLAVDVVLGPICTFLVYAPGKKSLRFDLTVIALIQVSAFAYGIYTSAIARPVYLVFLKDRFEVVSAADYPKEELEAAKQSPFLDFSWRGPKPVTAVMPENKEDKNRIMFSAIFGGGLKVSPRFYQPYSTVVATAIAQGKPLSAIQAAAPEQAKTVEEWLHAEGKDPAAVVFVPVKARLGYGLAMLDAKTGEILSMKGIDPSWYQ